jgi:hypothetical protein
MGGGGASSSAHDRAPRITNKINILDDRRANMLLRYDVDRRGIVAGNIPLVILDFFVQIP